ncbi:peptidylprolyl isomerase [Sphingomonas sanguinis]|uniref:peptidylprolyl isomerase n=1 Tax=Sphingomonas sp. LC-1 TaxID=3110957 RepID=UPI0021BA86B3|nr:peptidylprolyl isomerase [Sphingomonas sp. LC-1]MCT8002667.1 peptidylprolyl isomerase [Sphingomonas sp. LC-1]
MIPLLSLVLLAAQTTAVSPPAPATTEAPKPVMVRVAMQTSLGPVVLELDRTHAPITTANFLRYVDQHRLDGVTFYRSVRPAANFGFVQFGIQNEPKRILPPIAHEPTTKTGIKHLDGAISVARLAPGSARGDFTIMVGDQPSLDADPSKSGDNLGYAAFGHVVEGMDVIHRILDAPADPAKGPFKGEMLAAPVKILSAKRVAAAK